MAVRPLSSALQSLPFSNSGVVTSALNITTDYVDVIYLEPEAPTKARWSWADGHLTPFKDHRYIFDGDIPGVYSNTSRAPPLGVRSAPPLGGLAAGTIELRADGTLRQWTIENASPPLDQDGLARRGRDWIACQRRSRASPAHKAAVRPARCQRAQF